MVLPAVTCFIIPFWWGDPGYKGDTVIAVIQQSRIHSEKDAEFRQL